MLTNKFTAAVGCTVTTTWGEISGNFNAKSISEIKFQIVPYISTRYVACVCHL